MNFSTWNSPIYNDDPRFLDMVEINPRLGGLRVVVKDDVENAWELFFNPVQAWTVTSEECAGELLSGYPDHGNMFQIEGSKWLETLGKRRHLEKAKHFVVCCYDEIIEVLAWTCEVTKMN